jgi:hypothetical protein
MTYFFSLSDHTGTKTTFPGNILMLGSIMSFHRRKRHKFAAIGNFAGVLDVIVHC